MIEGLSELIDQPISRQQGWEYLKQMRMRLRVPRPSHQEADPDEQEAWKKNFSRKWGESNPSTPAPTSKFGVKMNTGLDYIQLCVASGSNLENNLLPQLIGSGSGCGYMRLFNPKLDKRKEWILPYVNTLVV